MIEPELDEVHLRQALQHAADAGAADIELFGERDFLQAAARPELF